MANILETIMARKAVEVVEAQSQISLDEIKALAQQMPPAKPFADVLLAKAKAKQSAVIAEIKKASPSQGVIREDFDPVAIAKSYQENGATCLSILTDVDFFQGSLAYLKAVRSAVDLPIIRKDFMLSPYQVYEARSAGADAILLIVAALDDQVLAELYHLAVSLGMSVLVEVHDQEELTRALRLPLAMVGINNRNLKTFEVSLQTTLDMLDQIPDGVVVVTESGISKAEDVQLMHQHDVYAFLVGERFMRAEDPGVALRALFG
jgi:indole-3-glycerol phosphate synthase